MFLRVKRAQNYSRTIKNLHFLVLGSRVLLVFLGVLLVYIILEIAVLHYNFSEIMPKIMNQDYFQDILASFGII